MYAVVRRNSFEPDRLAGARSALREFDELHAAQPGYIATVTIASRDGRRVVVNLWHSEHQATAALAVLGPAVRRLLEPLMSGPSELIAAGPVIATDLDCANASR